MEPGAYSDLLPSATENEEDNTSNDNKSCTSNSCRIRRVQDDQLNNTKVLMVSDENSFDQINSSELNGFRSPTSTDSESNRVLSLVWNNDNFGAHDRPKRKRRRCTQFTQSATSQYLRVSRQSSMRTNDHSLRQITLGSYLSSIKS